MAESATKPDEPALRLVAEGQRGFFTARQAGECGFSWALLSLLVKKGRLQRARQGVYRLPECSSSPDDQIVIAWLHGGPADAVVSHQTALGLLSLIDEPIDPIHITVRRHKRRQGPAGVIIHTSQHFPSPSETITLDGLPVTAAARSLVDIAAAGDGSRHFVEATRRALDRGLTNPTQLLLSAQERRGRTHILIRRALQLSSGSS